MKPNYHVIVIGGGLAGLCCAIKLAQTDLRVLVIERKKYPSHKVCGEYVSSETLPFLRSIGLDPYELGAAEIKKFRVSTSSGREIRGALDLGGFGLSRYRLDEALYRIALSEGVEFSFDRVSDVTFEGDRFTVQSDQQTYEGTLCIGCYGKRDRLDKKLERDFLNHPSGYMGVKYHIRTDYPLDEVGLDLFPGGYCGIAKIEADLFNLCYLYRRNSTRPFRDIRELEAGELYKNPRLKNIFRHSDFVWEKPLVINEISFRPKQLIENHILMCGDSAGLITPLCGNGMAMAIHGAKILWEEIAGSGVTSKGWGSELRSSLENRYQARWRKTFGSRLFAGRTLQRFFHSRHILERGMQIVRAFPMLKNKLVASIHGEPF